MTMASFVWPAWAHGAITIVGLAAAIVAVLAPEIFMTHGALIGTWRDGRLPAAVAATAFYAWRPGVLGPLLAGLAVYMPLHVGFGW